MAPEASIFSHFLVPTAVSCALPAGSCSGSCIGNCSGLLGRCKPTSKSLVSSVCDRDLRNVTAVWLLPLLYSAPEFFLVPAGFEALLVPPLFRFNTGCFRAAVPGTDLEPSAGAPEAPSGTMQGWSKRGHANFLLHFSTYVTTCSQTVGQSGSASQRSGPQAHCHTYKASETSAVIALLCGITRVSLKFGTGVTARGPQVKWAIVVSSNLTDCLCTSKVSRECIYVRLRSQQRVARAVTSR